MQLVKLLLLAQCKLKVIQAAQFVIKQCNFFCSNHEGILTMARAYVPLKV
jgi:hypothetical protein